jgi:hypothetical protein
MSSVNNNNVPGMGGFSHKTMISYGTVNDKIGTNWNNMTVMGNSGIGYHQLPNEYRSFPPTSGGVTFGENATWMLNGQRGFSAGQPILEITYNNLSSNVAPVDQVSTVTLGAQLSSGKYALEFQGYMTQPLMYNATVAQISTALFNLPSTRNLSNMSRNDGRIVPSASFDASAAVAFTYSDALGGQEIVDTVKFVHLTAAPFTTLEYSHVMGSACLGDPTSYPPELRYADVPETINRLEYWSANGSQHLYTIRGSDMDKLDSFTVNPVLQETFDQQSQPQNSLGSTEWLAKTGPKPRILYRLPGPFSIPKQLIPLYNFEGDFSIVVYFNDLLPSIKTNYTTGLSNLTGSIATARMYLRLQDDNISFDTAGEKIVTRALVIQNMPFTMLWHQLHMTQSKYRLQGVVKDQVVEIVLQNKGFHAGLIFWLLPANRQTADDESKYILFKNFQIYNAAGLSITGFTDTSREFLQTELMANQWVGTNDVQPKQPQYVHKPADKLTKGVGVYSFAQNLREDFISSTASGSKYFEGDEKFAITFPETIASDCELFITFATRRWYKASKIAGGKLRSMEMWK